MRVKLAAIDIGTNSIHMVIVEATSGRGFEVVDREKAMVMLGKGLFSTGRLSERAFAEGLEVLRRFAGLAESHGVRETLAVATSATREALNGGQFLHAVETQTGLYPRVISGTEEAHLIYQGVRHALDLRGERSAVLDIGGGSIEVAVGAGNEVLLSDSLRLGVLRLLERHGSSDPLGTKEIHELEGYAEGVAAATIESLVELDVKQAVGTAGTIRALGEAAHQLSGGNAWRSVNAQTVRRKDLRDLSRKLCAMNVQERARIESIGVQRAEAIHLGAVVLVKVLELAGLEKITLCDASLREGVILQFLARHGVAFKGFDPTWDTRRRSVVALARKYERDDPHERHIAELALQLFDQTGSLHELGPEHRQLLEYAALLHGVGQQINYASRHKHSRYIVRHSQLRGCTDHDIELLGQLVRYHRRRQPTKGTSHFASFRSASGRSSRCFQGCCGWRWLWTAATGRWRSE